MGYIYMGDIFARTKLQCVCFFCSILLLHFEDARSPDYVRRLARTHLLRVSFGRCSPHIQLDGA